MRVPKRVLKTVPKKCSKSEPPGTSKNSKNHGMVIKNRVFRVPAKIPQKDPKWGPKTGSKSIQVASGGCLQGSPEICSNLHEKLYRKWPPFGTLKSWKIEYFWGPSGTYSSLEPQDGPRSPPSSLPDPPRPSKSMLFLMFFFNFLFMHLWYCWWLFL